MKTEKWISSEHRKFIKQQDPRSGEGLLSAGGKGFEPLSTDPESVVLPLDEPPPKLPLSAAFFPAGWILPRTQTIRLGFYRHIPFDAEPILQ